MKLKLKKNITVAEKLLDKLSEDAVDIFGDRKCETKNIYCLQHLPDQVRRFGSLFVMSAMCFKSAHAFLANFASVSHEFRQIICRCYLEYQQLLHAS